MRPACSLFIFIFCFSLSAYSQLTKFVAPSGVKCNGQQYWKLKTLDDNEGRQIDNINTPRETTIAALRKIKRPTATRPQTRWLLEKKAILLRCTIDTSGFEDDGDIHIIIRDLKTRQSMVAEIPNPDCENVKNTPFFKKIEKAFKNYLKISGTNTKFSGVFEITGVPFFDKKHTGIGAAPTMIEIHPVLEIRKIN